MSVLYSTKLALAHLSGGICALPGCGLSLSTDDVSNPRNIGVAAHIAGKHKGSARYDPNMTDAERNHCNNLIYLCPNCHTTIDLIPVGVAKYSVPILKLIKEEHEGRIRNSAAVALPNIGFEELQSIVEWCTQGQFSREQPDFSHLKTSAKIDKNSLGSSSRWTIEHSLAVSGMIKDFMGEVAKQDPDFPERLKYGFLQEYSRPKRQGQDGDELFALMCKFAQRGYMEPAKQAAGWAVLVYLFEICEVFEK